MKIIQMDRKALLKRIAVRFIFALTALLIVTECSKSAEEEPEVEISSGEVSGGYGTAFSYVIYRLSGDYSDNVAVLFSDVVLGKNGERKISGKIIGIPDNREDGKSPVRKLDEGFYSGKYYSPEHVFLTLKYADYKTSDDLDKANRPGNYGYTVIREARVTQSYAIETVEFWRIAGELFPEDKEKYGVYWGDIYHTDDVFDKTMNRLIADGLPGFELVYDETTYDPATDGK